MGIEKIIYITQPTANSGVLEYIGASARWGGLVAQKAKARNKRNKRDWQVIRLDKNLAPVNQKQFLRDIHTNEMQLALQVKHTRRVLPPGEY